MTELGEKSGNPDRGSLIPALAEFVRFAYVSPAMKIPSLLLVLVISVLLTSCGSFERDWKQSVAQYQARSVSSPSGPWTGTWSTPGNGHTGNLRAIVKPSPSTPGEYRFRYHATWAKVFSGGYTVSYPVTGSPGNYAANGKENLGGFGTFDHTAKITKTKFTASFSNNKGDVGKFAMTRPAVQ